MDLALNKRVLAYAFHFTNIIGFTVSALIDNTSNMTVFFTGCFVVSVIMVCRDIWREDK